MRSKTYAEASYAARLSGYLDQIRDTLARAEIRGAETPELVCTACGEPLCRVEEFDTLDVLASVAIDHACDPRARAHEAHIAAIGGRCSHGGHGWEGETCSDIDDALASS